MKMLVVQRTAAFAVIAVVLVFSCVGSNVGRASATMYDLEPLGVLEGRLPTPNALSENGYITGWFVTGLGETHAFRYKDGNLEDFDPLGSPFSRGLDVNNSGVVVGEMMSIDGRTHACRIRPGFVQNLDEAGSTGSCALTINNNGLIGGWADFGYGLGMTCAALFTDEGRVDLGILPGGYYSCINDLADTSRGTGYSYHWAPLHVLAPVIHDPGAEYSMPVGNRTLWLMLVPFGFDPVGNAINVLGNVSGTCRFPNTGGAWGSHPAAFFSQRSLNRIDMILEYASVGGMNDLNEVVGSYSRGQDAWAFTYRNREVRNTNWDVDPESGWVVKTAVDINNKGQVIGTGTHHGIQEAFIATRRPESQVTGQASLSGFVGDTYKIEIPYRILSSIGSTVEQFGKIYIEPSGDYVLNTHLIGDYDLEFKGPSHLTKKIQVQLDGTGLDGVSFALVAGDIDGDDAITVFDYSLLSEAFDSTEGDPRWNAKADLDGDGAVTVFDYAILSENFDLSGD